jgi:outer membrane protein OmpA-like peptidoglycan-associated protein
MPAAEDQQLAQLIAFYRHYGRCHIEIRGAADATGSQRYNLWLSWRRANAVAEALMADGVDPWRIQVTPRGSADARPGAGQNERRADARVTCEASPPSG